MPEMDKKIDYLISVSDNVFASTNLMKVCH